MGRAGRAGITVCVSWFPSLHSSTLGPIMVPETPDGKITLLLVPLSLLHTVKPQRNKHFFFLETAEGIQLPVWPQTCSEAIPIPIFLQGCIAFVSDLIPTLPLPAEAAATRFSMVMAWLWRSGNVVAVVGGTLSAQVGLLAKMLLQDQPQPRLRPVTYLIFHSNKAGVHPCISAQKYSLCCSCSL